MTDLIFAAAGCVAVLLLHVAAGFILRCTKRVGDGFGKEISSLLLNLCMPALVIRILAQEFTIEALKTGYPAILIGFVVIAITSIPAFLLKRAGKDKGFLNVLAFSLVFSNFGFMGQPMVEAVYGSDALLTWALFTISYYALVNIIGMYILAPQGQKMNAKLIFNPNTVGVIIGIILALFRIPIPTVVMDLLNMCGNCVVPLSMILIGFVLAGHPLRAMVSNLRIYGVAALRLLVLPLCVMGVLYLCGFRGFLLAVPVIIIAMPVAVNGVMLAEDMGGDSLQMAQAVFVSSVLSLLSVPLIAVILAMVQG